MIKVFILFTCLSLTNVSFMSERIWLVAPDSDDTFISSHKSQETVSPKPQWDILSS